MYRCGWGILLAVVGQQQALHMICWSGACYWASFIWLLSVWVNHWHGFYSVVVGTVWVLAALFSTL